MMIVIASFIFQVTARSAGERCGGMNENHEVERFENLMYKGCEPHWHCIYCDGYWPFHCYGKKDLEQMECPTRKAQREDEAASDMRDYCEHYEPTYNPEDGSM